MARREAAGLVKHAWCAAAACALLVAALAAAPASALEASAKLGRQLREAGRAEVSLRYDLPAAPGAQPRPVAGSLALEPPDRVRLDVPASGERLVASGEGGAWLQPATKQLLRFGPRQAAPALRWWRVLLGASEGVRERRVAQGQYVLVLADRSGVADSATVWLDSHGLPARLAVGGPDDTVTYRLNGWRFTRAHGAQAFRLAAPTGYETVDLP
jgi:hypothetical protein